MGEGVEEDVAHTGESVFWWVDETGLPPLDVGIVELLAASGKGGTLQPLLELLLVKFDEDAFTSHFGGGHPGG